MNSSIIIRSSDRISGTPQNCHIQLNGIQNIPIGKPLECLATFFIENFEANVYCELRSDIGLLNNRDTRNADTTMLFFDSFNPKKAMLNTTNFTKKLVNFELLNSRRTPLLNFTDNNLFSGEWVLHLNCREVKEIN